MAIDTNSTEYMLSSRLASLFANRAYVTMEGGVTRIAFGEAAANVGEGVYHTAITMSVVDAVGLANTILGIFDQLYPPTPPPPTPPTGLGGLTGQRGLRLGENYLDPPPSVPRKPGG